MNLQNGRVCSLSAVDVIDGLYLVYAVFVFFFMSYFTYKITRPRKK